MSFWERFKARRRFYPPNHRHNDQWCERHWAPYRGTGLPAEQRPNGILGSMLMMEAFLDLAHADLQDTRPETLNRVMAESRLPVCCRLGDLAMATILEACKNLTIGQRDLEAIRGRVAGEIRDGGRGS